jgi:hypothetical protein
MSLGSQKQSEKPATEKDIAESLIHNYNQNILRYNQDSLITHKMSLIKTLAKNRTYFEAYPSMSKSVEMSLRMIVDDIKRIKKSGDEFTDIQDHPMVKRHLKDLEKFI